MSLVDDLEQIRQRLGRSIVLPTPPACQALIAHAKAAGIEVGTVFVLSRSLVPGVRGSYDRRSGDLWCHYDGGEDEGARDVLLCLLTLLAHVKLHLPPPTTIEEDWEQAHCAHQEAAALARAWDREELFSASDLEAFLAYDHHLSLCHVAAGELAGTCDPSLARDAYRALLEVQQRYHWENTQFAAALGGVWEDHEEANAAVLDFDRCLLRMRWLAPVYKREEMPDPLGTFALPQTPRTARVLRSALQQVARHRAEHKEFLVADRTFCHLEGEQDLPLVIEQVNAWLLEELPACYARVRWTLYADSRWRETATPSAHLYHMSVDYVDGEEKESVDGGGREPIRRELWVLVPARKRGELVEAAWQRYLRSWLTCTGLHTDALYYGVQALWSWLQ